MQFLQYRIWQVNLLNYQKINSQWKKNWLDEHFCRWHSLIATVSRRLAICVDRVCPCVTTAIDVPANRAKRIHGSVPEPHQPCGPSSKSDRSGSNHLLNVERQWPLKRPLCFIPRVLFRNHLPKRQSGRQYIEILICYKMAANIDHIHDLQNHWNESMLLLGHLGLKWNSLVLSCRSHAWV